MIAHETQHTLKQKYFLLENGDLIREGDEAFFPEFKKWIKLKTGGEFGIDQHTPVRRVNKNFSK